MLMQTLAALRLCDGQGTVFWITKLGQNILGATILTGVGKGKRAMIPWIPIIPTDLPFQFKMIKFSAKLSFTGSTNKAQGKHYRKSECNWTTYASLMVSFM